MIFLTRVQVPNENGERLVLNVCLQGLGMLPEGEEKTLFRRRVDQVIPGSLDTL